MKNGFDFYLSSIFFRFSALENAVLTLHVQKGKFFYWLRGKGEKFILWNSPPNNIDLSKKNPHNGKSFGDI